MKRSCDNMHDASRRSLDSPIDHEQARPDDFAAAAFHKRGPDYHVGDSGLVFERDKHDISAAWPLAYQHDACYADPRSIPRLHHFSAGQHTCGGQCKTEKTQWMRLDR